MVEGLKTIRKPVSAWADSRVAELLSRVRSPGLPRHLGDIPSADGHYTFEYLEGETLRQLPGEELTPANLQRWFDQVLDSLALVSLFAGLPFAHLDLSPENIVITRQGRACPIDFASSRFLDGKADLADSSRVLTAGYAAPEIYFGQLCPEADLYSLAMSVLAVYSGRMAAELDGRLIKKIMNQLGRPLAQKLRACLSEDPALRRPAAAGTLYQAALEIKSRQEDPREEIKTEAIQDLSSARPSNTRSVCPFQLDDCPFLELADRFNRVSQSGNAPESRPAACYNKPEDS